MIWINPLLYHRHFAVLTGVLFIIYIAVLPTALSKEWARIFERVCYGILAMSIYWSTNSHDIKKSAYISYTIIFLLNCVIWVYKVFILGTDFSWRNWWLPFSTGIFAIRLSQYLRKKLESRLAGGTEHRGFEPLSQDGLSDGGVQDFEDTRDLFDLESQAPSQAPEHLTDEELESAAVENER